MKNFMFSICGFFIFTNLTYAKNHEVPLYVVSDKASTVDYFEQCREEGRNINDRLELVSPQSSASGEIKEYSHITGKKMLVCVTVFKNIVKELPLITGTFQIDGITSRTSCINKAKKISLETINKGDDNAVLYSKYHQITYGDCEINLIQIGKKPKYNKRSIPTALRF